MKPKLEIKYNNHEYDPIYGEDKEFTEKIDELRKLSFEEMEKLIKDLDELERKTMLKESNTNR